MGDSVALKRVSVGVNKHPPLALMGIRLKDRYTRLLCVCVCVCVCVLVNGGSFMVDVIQIHLIQSMRAGSRSSSKRL